MIVFIIDLFKNDNHNLRQCTLIPITNSDRLAMLGPLPNPKTLTIVSWFRRQDVMMICACYSRCELDSSMCSTVGGVYHSTRDLLQLEAVTSVPLVEGVSVEGVLPFPIWDHNLCSHPDREYADFLRMASKLDLIALTSSNLLRGTMNPPLIIWATPRDISMGRWQPCAFDGFPLTPRCTWSPIGLVPKDHQPGKFRLIIDLSSPMGASINDGINSDLTSLTYPGP